MHSKCVKGPFVNALPMTLSGIVKGINTLRARNCQSFPFFSFFFFIGATAIDAADGKQNAGTRSIGHRMFIHFSRSFVVFCTYFIARPLHQSLEKLRDRTPILLAIRMVLFSCYSSQIIFFNRVSSYSFSNCCKTNFETYRLEIFKIFINNKRTVPIITIIL